MPAERSATEHAVVAERSAGMLRSCLVRLVLQNDAGALYGQEGILRNGASVGLTSSGAWSHNAGAPIALGYVTDAAGIDDRWFAEGVFTLDVPGGAAPVRCLPVRC
jgi:4-methylaminobutanoate oxidase (formaldehyde-forming)